MENIVLDENDELIMKLLHYFVTVQNYSPIVLKGAHNEIWLEKLDGDYKIVRLVSNYIHNNEQLNIDLYRTSQIMKRIKKKTMSFSINALSIFTNLGENVNLDNSYEENIDIVDIKSVDELKKYDYVMKEFPDITSKMKYDEKGFELFVKLTDDIGRKSDDDAKKAEDVFNKKDPIVTKILLALNTIVFVLSFFLDYNYLIRTFGNTYSGFINGQYYRLITSAFLHAGLLHYGFNMYALYILGPQLENFFGKAKFLGIYLLSAICGNLFSIGFNTSSVSIGASGAIFGLLGALIYFGYHYRVYLDSVIKSQIIPLIIFNLALGFIFSNVDVFAHIGGLIGGAFSAWALGVKYRSTNSDRINGLILLIIFVVFSLFLIFGR